MLPLDANLTVQVISNKPNFIIRCDDSKLSKEFVDIANIELYNVKIVNGVIFGTYKKPKTLDFYDLYVDKDKFENYADFHFNVIGKNKEVDNGYISHNSHFLYENGNLTDKFKDKIVYMDKAFFQIRIGYGDTVAQVVVMEYRGILDDLN